MDEPQGKRVDEPQGNSVKGWTKTAHNTFRPDSPALKGYEVEHLHNIHTVLHFIERKNEREQDPQKRHTVLCIDPTAIVTNSERGKRYWWFHEGFYVRRFQPNGAKDDSFVLGVWKYSVEGNELKVRPVLRK